jgi:dihydroneopterin aldolase
MIKSKFFLIIILSILITSCDDDEDNMVDTLTIDEAVEIIEASMAGESAGLAETMTEYVKVFVNEISQNVKCNETTTNSYNFNHDGTFTQAA